MKRLFEYMGYDVVATQSGGKAGKGFNRTASIQVRQSYGGKSYLIMKAFSCVLHTDGAMRNAILKAKSYIDKLNTLPATSGAERANEKD